MLFYVHMVWTYGRQAPLYPYTYIIHVNPTFEIWKEKVFTIFGQAKMAQKKIEL